MPPINPKTNETAKPIHANLAQSLAFIIFSSLNIKYSTHPIIGNKNDKIFNPADAPPTELIGVPHFGQKVLPSGIIAPHFVQNCAILMIFLPTLLRILGGLRY